MGWARGYRLEYVTAQHCLYSPVTCFYQPQLLQCLHHAYLDSSYYSISSPLYHISDNFVIHKLLWLQCKTWVYFAWYTRHVWNNWKLKSNDMGTYWQIGHAFEKQIFCIFCSGWIDCGVLSILFSILYCCVIGWGYEEY